MSAFSIVSGSLYFFSKYLFYTFVLQMFTYQCAWFFAHLYILTNFVCFIHEFLWHVLLHTPAHCSCNCLWQARSEMFNFNQVFENLFGCLVALFSYCSCTIFETIFSSVSGCPTIDFL